MNKIVIFTLLAISSVATYFVVAGGSESSNTKVAPLAVETPQQNVAEIPKDMEFYDKKDKELMSLPKYNLDISEIDEALELNEIASVDIDMPHEHKDIFLESSINIVSQEFPQKDGIEPLSAIEIKKDSISKVKIGDTITLPFVDDAKYRAKISDKIIHKDGSTSITGNLINSNKKYSVVLTQGKNSSFGSLTTPEGTYEIEVLNGKGYVYSVNDIDKKRIDYTKEDVIQVDKES
jgi:hypothetical protein